MKNIYIKGNLLVFPACAGVILPYNNDIVNYFCFPRMRGGDPVFVLW